MRHSVYRKNIKRTIFGSFGRYIAILAIIALGVGFFAGVKNTKGSMLKTCNKYVNELNMYDYRLISTYGFDEDDEKYINDTEGVGEAEGAVSADFFSEDGDGNSIILRAHSITEKVNLLRIEEGHMPENDNECVVDGHFYTSSDIGKKVKITNENDEDSKEIFTCDEYEIVGIVNSPYYMMKTERGTTSLGDGRLNAYVYMTKNGFSSDYYTEMLVTSDKQGFVFSDEYNNNIEKEESKVTAAAKYRADVRFNDIISEAQGEIDAGQKEIDEGRKTLENERSKAYSELKKAKNTLDDKAKELENGKKTLAAERSALNENKDELSAQLAYVNQNIEASKQPDSGVSQEQIEQMEAQSQSMTESLNQIESGLKEISEKEKELDKGRRELDSGYSEYKSSREKAEAEFASAENELKTGEAELEKAKNELAEISAPEIYTQTREDNIGYDSFESNSEIVDSIAKVFPIFFFLIAALVCSTTMSRMIEEERTQIGSLRAMGYTNGRIMWKYMVYSGSAAVIGCVAGFFAGSKYFPYAIWIAYGMMFGFAPIEFYFSWKLFAVSLIVSLICSTGTTYFACRGQLKYTPAEILRPRAPKAGKRIILEKIPFIWNNLKFLHKVSARNILRYKKRMVMMIMGIGGCTALVMAGFGINDSVAGIAEHQYSDIEKYHMTVAFSKELDESELAEFYNLCGNELDNTAVLQQTSVSAKGSGGVNKTCNLMITGDKNIESAVNFSSEGKQIDYPGKGEAVINNKFAEMLNVDTGDEITVKYDDTKQTVLKVSGVYRNYVSNYIYINNETYEEKFNKTYEPSIAFVTVKDGVDVYEMSEKIYGFDDVMGISVNEDTKNRVGDMMVSLNYIIILVIGCAGALAFIVLFNLGNINITERVREIATIEVLGFYPRETGSYVFRENFILVLLGIAAGLPAGYVLYKFIMSQINVDAVAFNEIIEPWSYVFTVLVVLGFTFIVDIIMRRKLKKINMAEALKSVE